MLLAEAARGQQMERRMRLTDTRIERTIDKVRVVGVVETEDRRPLQLWFEFARTYEPFVSAKADSFMIALLVPAMAEGERLESVAAVSEPLLFNRAGPVGAGVHVSEEVDIALGQSRLGGSSGAHRGESRAGSRIGYRRETDQAPRADGEEARSHRRTGDIREELTARPPVAGATACQTSGGPTAEDALARVYRVRAGVTLAFRGVPIGSDRPLRVPYAQRESP